MTVFAVVALDQNLSGPLTAAVHEKFAGRFFEVAAGHFLINAVGTSQEIAIQLNVTIGGVGRTMVYNVGGYFGYAPNQTWEWLKTNMSAGATGASGA